ncbi:MAG TPA: methyltransferase domain-containing protein [Terriglobia bacterium]|nr:methyltransferase domain-containing protein [Terriglobia bacterium]
MAQTAQFTSDVEQAVRERYSKAATATESCLCSPAAYDKALLAAIPDEVVEKDYGCGNPSAHLRPGDRVLDLGSGSGKACFIAGQIVGPSGRVTGVDMNDEMLAIARRNAPILAERLGYANVEFKKGRIQDLALDLEKLEGLLKERPVRSAADLSWLEAATEQLRSRQPLIPDGSVDIVISNCVLNLVKPHDKEQLFSEIFRVLSRGGRAVISDIVSDEDVPAQLQADPELWSGCISGAFREDLFLAAFEKAGFYGVQILDRQKTPWRTVEGIEFRSVTVAAYKGKEGACLDQKHAVIYRGPFREVVDDDGHALRRGIRTAVCEKTFNLYSREPYRSHFELVPPRVLIPLEEAPAFPCSGGALRRHPRETKGEDYKLTTETLASACCSPDSAIAVAGGEKGCC